MTNSRVFQRFSDIHDRLSFWLGKIKQVSGHVEMGPVPIIAPVGNLAVGDDHHFFVETIATEVLEVMMDRYHQETRTQTSQALVDEAIKEFATMVANSMWSRYWRERGTEDGLDEDQIDLLLAIKLKEAEDDDTDEEYRFLVFECYQTRRRPGEKSRCFSYSVEF